MDKKWREESFYFSSRNTIKKGTLGEGSEENEEFSMMTEQKGGGGGGKTT